MIKTRLIALVCLIQLVSGVLINNTALANDSVVQQLKSGGHVALMRHALAPGTGDPSNFMLGVCNTQRNLNDTGRAQAADTGDYFRAAEVEFHSVYSSEWCRCMDTAALMELGAVQPLPLINSFFQNMQDRESQTQELVAWLAEQSIDKPWLLVTHQVNITALTGVYPQSGEIVVGRLVDGKFEVAGTIEPR